MMVGSGGSSMFYLVIIFFVLYAIGMSLYLLAEKIKKDRRRKGNG